MRNDDQTIRLKSTPRAWLEGLSTRMPITPPFGGVSYSVVGDSRIVGGEGWNALGVDIRRHHVDSPGSTLAVGTMTPEQARSLARALEAAADEAELRSYIPDGPA